MEQTKFKVPDETEFKVPDETEFKVPDETEFNVPKEMEFNVLKEMDLFLPYVASSDVLSETHLSSHNKLEIKQIGFCWPTCGHGGR